MSAEQVAALRRMTAELSEDTYSDAALEGRIAAAGGDEADLAPIAADIWTEKAGALAGSFNFTADGATFNRADMHKHALGMARHYRAQRAAASVTIAASPPILRAHPLAVNADECADECA